MSTPERVGPAKRRYWLHGLIICAAVLFLAATTGVTLVVNAHNTSERRAEFCEALPNAAAAGAQSLIDIAIEQARKRGEPDAQIAQTRMVGVLYVNRARAAVKADLKSCPD